MKQLPLLSLLFLFSFSAFAQPANNTCATAVTLYASSNCINVAGNMQNANNTAPAGACGGATGTTTFDVWYSFTATASSATVTLSGLGSSLNAATTYIQVLSTSNNACNGTLTSVGCQAATSSLTVSGLTAGNLHYVRVYVTTNPNTGTLANWNFNICLTAPVPNTRLNEVFTDTIIGRNAAGFDSPWEITYEPREDSLWITENRTYRIRKMAPNGNSRVILDLSETGSFPSFRRTFNSSQNPWPQGGMMGFAIHPKFLDPVTPKNYVYVAYVRAFAGQGPYNNAGTGVRQTVTNPFTSEQVKGDLFTTFLVRFDYNTTTKSLENPVALCDSIPGSNDHNSGRLLIAPAGGTDYLFYSVGDMGAGQFYSAERTIKSQITNSYEGKILRFNLESDGDAGTYDRWIPSAGGAASNPYNNVSPVTGQSAVWSIGHRNVQGLAYTNNTIYGSSHGPFTDDVVNILQAGKNHGHPRIIGYAFDRNYDGARAASASFRGWNSEFSVANALISSLPLISNEATDSISLMPNYQTPIYSFFPAPRGASGTTGTVQDIYINNPVNSGWPSIAPSGMDAYNNTKIPGWRNSLFLASLKRGYIMRIKPNAAGTGVDQMMGSDTVTIANTTNRFRDLAFDPNGWSFYGVVDRNGQTSGPTATNAVNSSCPGCVIKYTFLGYTASGSAPNTTSNIPADIRIDSSLSAGCVTATAVTINTANKNNNLWVPITGPNGNLIAELNANGNDLGNVTTSFFTRTGTPVRTWGASRYLNRNVTINVQTQPLPGTPVSVRLYLTAKELADMIASPGSGVTGITGLGVFKNNDVCGSVFGNGLSAGQTISGRYAQSTFGHAVQFNVTSFSSFYFFNASATLPFDLISFTGKAVNDASKLEWVVANQRDVQSYTVERSLDGIKFDDIATVQPKSGNGDITYNYTDFNAAGLGTVIYYRIRSNEPAGSKYTNIINVNFAPVLITSLSLFPNPVTEKTNVLINAIADETVQLKVIDNTGRIIHVMNVNLVKGKNNVQLDVSRYKTGLYYIDVTGKAINEKAKLIKQ
ncbi:MAG: PQQ-dependent sugar dehydrogenase [Chitinophagaceae bacterium]|nr:PQQ-dependent sugar dehydrogenase [Chitinophagaceae bacterium]